MSLARLSRRFLSSVLLLAGVPTLATASPAAPDYVIEWDWGFFPGGLAPTVTPLPLNPAQWIGFDPVWIEYRLPSPAPEETPSFKAQRILTDYVVEWDWDFNPAGVLVPPQGPLVVDPAIWTGFNPFLEYIIDTPALASSKVKSTKVLTDYVVEWDWQVGANGAPIAPAPLSLDPTSWTGFDPFLEYVIPVTTYSWTSVTFTQVAGPGPFFGTVTIQKDQLSNCGTFLVDAGCTPIPPQPQSGTYTIQATVQPGGAIAQATVTILPTAEWTSITFAQVAGPVPGAFGSVTIDRGQISNCGTSIVNAGCTPLGQCPGTYTIEATVQPSGAMSRSTVTILPTVQWSQITFTQIGGPAPNVFAPVTINRGQISNCGTSNVNANCRAFAPPDPPFGVYTIAATVYFEAPCPAIPAAGAGTINVGPGPANDTHYWSYSLEAPLDTSITIDAQDQFLATGVLLDTLSRLVNWVHKNGSVVSDTTLHFTWWNIQNKVPARYRAQITNQFGSHRVQVHNLEFLLAPALKNDPPTPWECGSHYLCYRASGFPGPDATYDLEDEWRSDQQVVDSLEYLCVPCRKVHDAHVFDPCDLVTHLAVYRIHPQSDRFLPLIEDQFVNDEFYVQQQLPKEYLFVPSAKTEVAALAVDPPQQSSDTPVSTWPNPMRQGCKIEFTVVASGEIDLTIFGIDGRRIRTLNHGRSEPGAHRTTWDGMDDRGLPVSSGLYFVRLKTVLGQFTRPIVYVR